MGHLAAAVLAALVAIPASGTPMHLSAKCNTEVLYVYMCSGFIGQPFELNFADCCMLLPYCSWHGKCYPYEAGKCQLLAAPS